MKYPPLIIITNRDCNNICDHCSIENRKNNKGDEISNIELLQIVQDFKFIDNIHLFWWEPTIKKNFIEHLNIINKNNICPWIITNWRLFEKQVLDNAFWIKLKESNIRKINISVSIDYFHKKNFILRNGKEDKYPTKMLYNIWDAAKYDIDVNLNINWVYSNIKEHYPTKEDYNNIINILHELKKDKKIKSYKFILDPLQKKSWTNIDNIYKKCKLNPYILKEPSKNPKEFNFCSPYICAKKKNNNIKYYFCMYIGDKSNFSSLWKDIKEDLKNFFLKHNRLKDIVDKKNNVYSLLNKYNNDEWFNDFLNSKQECFKENRACSICKYLFNKNII